MALLIGNLNYSHHPGLMAPTMDVHELANLLQQLDFRVVSLLDLTLQEMQAAIDKFLQLLDRGVYGESPLVGLHEEPLKIPAVFLIKPLTVHVFISQDVGFTFRPMTCLW